MSATVWHVGSAPALNKDALCAARLSKFWRDAVMMSASRIDCNLWKTKLLAIAIPLSIRNNLLVLQAPHS